MSANIEDPPEGIIQAIARLKHVDLEHASADCLLYVYALAFVNMEKILEKKPRDIVKSSVQRIEDALQDIRLGLRDLKRAGKLKGKKLSDVTKISPIIEKTFGVLTGVLEAEQIIEQYPPEQQLSPEELQLRLAATRQRNEDLATCGRHVADIIEKVEWWIEDEKAQECSKEQSESPTPIPFIDKDAKRRQQLA